MEQWFLYTNECVTSCPMGYIASNSTCEQADLTPPDPSLSVNSNNSLIISFTKPIYMNITASDLDLEVTDVDGLVYSTTWSEPIIEDQSTFLLKLTINATKFPNNNQCILTFLHPSSVVDLIGVSIVKNQLMGVLHGYGNAASPSHANTTAVKERAAVVAKGGVGAVAATSIINGSPGSFWSLLNQLQMITYLPMTRMPVPDGLMATLGALNVGSFVPNPFEYALPSNESSQSPPDYAKRYEVNSSLFLLNTGLIMGSGVGLVLSLVPIYVASRLTTGFLSQYLRRLLPSFRWGIPLRWWLQSYLDISIYSLLQIQQVLTHNDLSALSVSCNFIVSAFFALAVLTTPLLVYSFLWKNHRDMENRQNEEFNKRWGVLYIEFDQMQGVSGFIYYPFFLTRRLIYALTIIWMYDYPETQALVNTSMAVAVSPR